MVFWYTRWDGQRFCSENDYGESKQNSNKLDKVTSYIAESNRKQQITYSDPRNKCYLTKCPECGEEVYFRITSSSRPTVETKYPLAQKLCPTKFRLRSPYTRAMWIALFPFMYPTTCDTACFGGIAISICT